MTRPLDEVFDNVDDRPPLKPTTMEEAELDEAIAEIARGELASADDVRAMWKKHGL
jgi:hypothetical protein